MWHLKYLGIKHDYYMVNCFTLIKDVYKNELNFTDFEYICSNVGVPNGTPIDKRRWIFRTTLTQIESHAVKFFKKVNLTEIQEFDLILFKLNDIRPFHFGVYVSQNKFLHVEEGNWSCLSDLDINYRDSVASIWRLSNKSI